MVKTKIIGLGGCGCNIAKQQKNSILLDKENIEYNLDSDINFVIAGLGGSTTMNHLSNLKLNKDKLNIAFFVLPFKIEEARRNIALKEVKRLKNKFSSILIFDNDFFVKTGKENIVKIFKNVNKFVNESINSLMESINYRNIASLDYKEFAEIFSSKKIGVVQKGIFEDKEIKKEISSANITKNNAKGLLINLTILETTTLEEINDIGEIFCNNLDEDSNVIWSARAKKKLKNIQIINFFIGVSFLEK